MGASQSLRCAGVRTSAVRSESRQGGVRHRRGREGGAHTHRPGGRPGARTGRQEVPGGGRRGVDPLHVGCPGRGSHIVIKGGGLFRPAKGGREVRQCAARRSIGGLGCLSAGFLSRNSRSEPETREYSPCLGPGGPGWRGHLPTPGGRGSRACPVSVQDLLSGFSSPKPILLFYYAAACNVPAKHRQMSREETH